MRRVYAMGFIYDTASDQVLLIKKPSDLLCVSDRWNGLGLEVTAVEDEDMPETVLHLCLEALGDYVHTLVDDTLAVAWSPCATIHDEGYDVHVFQYRKSNIMTRVPGVLIGEAAQHFSRYGYQSPVVVDNECFAGGYGDAINEAWWYPLFPTNRYGSDPARHKYSAAFAPFVLPLIHHVSAGEGYLDITVSPV